MFIYLDYFFLVFFLEILKFFGESIVIERLFSVVGLVLVGFEELF